MKIWKDKNKTLLLKGITKQCENKVVNTHGLKQLITWGVVYVQTNNLVVSYTSSGKGVT